MANFLDYLTWRGDVPITVDGTCVVDYAIFSQISLLDFKDLIFEYPSENEVILKDVSEKYFSTEYQKSMKIGLIIPDTILTLFKKMGNVQRYQDLKLSNYLDIVDETTEMQISAITIKINNDLRIISFSGTDDTIIGWKENVNMIYKSPIPAQAKAVEYIEKMMKLYSSDFIICGHSKGGNMSLYGGTHVSEQSQKRIQKIYNFDGPGLSKTESEFIEYIKKLDKVITIIPQTSIVGRLFEHREDSMIVKSGEVTFYQHDAFSWEVLGRDFVYEEELTKESKVMDQKLKAILQDMTPEEKEGFVEGLFNLLSSTDAKSLLELKDRKKALTQNYLKLPRDVRRNIMKPIVKLMSDLTVFNMVVKAVKEYRSLSKKANPIDETNE